MTVTKRKRPTHTEELYVVIRPLQLKLNDLAKVIAKVGSIVGGLLFVSLLIRFFVEIGTNSPSRTLSEKGILFVQILVILVTLVVVAVPEGLPLAITLALAFATKHMTKENLLVHVLGSFGIHAKFVHKLNENPARAGIEDTNRPNAKDFTVDILNLNSTLTPQLVKLLNASIAINSTAFEDVDSESGAMVFIGNKIETALLKFAKDLGWANYKDICNTADVILMIPFSIECKSTAIESGHPCPYAASTATVSPEMQIPHAQPPGSSSNGTPGLTIMPPAPSTSITGTGEFQHPQPLLAHQHPRHVHPPSLSTI
ncbi:hypothetical protein V8E52_006511 [Russula decolorans]